jgi:hypothetical protein
VRPGRRHALAYGSMQEWRHRGGVGAGARHDLGMHCGARAREGLRPCAGEGSSEGAGTARARGGGGMWTPSFGT